MVQNRLLSWDIQDKRIFLRIDGNVPLKQGTIIDDTRLKVILPTLDYLITHKSTVILATHLDDPHDIDPYYSTKQLVPWFEQHGYPCVFAPTIAQAHEYAKHNNLIILENLRFFKGEIQNDVIFAQTLASLADFYLNDAFGSLHRNHASLVAVAQQFPRDKRSVGFLIEKELNILDHVRTNPQRPFVLILGGKKIETKIPLLLTLIPLVDTVLLCPAIVFTFLKTMGKPVGNSLVNDSLQDLCKQIMHKAQEQCVKIVYPIDYQTIHYTSNGLLHTTSDDTIAHDNVGITIGPKTTERYAHEIKTAGTIVYNGAMGFIEKPETLHAIHALFNAIVASPGISIIAGGDSIAIARAMSITEHVDHISTGGSITLAYLGNQSLPGLMVLE